MACRIGITTDLERRKSEWLKIHPNLYGWQKLAGPFNSKEEAQDAENKLAKLHGCEAHPGGDDIGQWWVYKFHY